MIGAAEAIIFQFLPTLCASLSLLPFFPPILYILESRQYSLVTNKSHITQKTCTDTGRQTHINTHRQTQLSGLLVSLGGPAVAAPSQRGVCVSVCVCVCVHACVCVCVSVCWAGSDQFLLILVHRITARLSHPITAWDC